MKKLVCKEEEGFSLIELVVVVAVLGVLSAIAIPSFNCFQRKSKATAALAAIRQVQSECAVKKADTGSIGNFTQNNLNSYQIQSDGSNGCGGASGTGLISAIPSDTNLLPTFILATNTNQLTFSFKGQNGIAVGECLKLICGNQLGNKNQEGSGDNDQGDESQELTECQYVSMDNLANAKWMYHMCEEARQKVNLCQHPYVHHSAGPPFPVVPCTSLCTLAYQQNWSSSWTQYHCNDNRNAEPPWLSGGDNAQMNSLGFDKDSIIQHFKDNGYQDSP